MSRLQRIDNAQYAHLRVDDRCYHYGEYTAHGGFQVSETNNQILNLKKKPGSSPGQLYYKKRAIEYWAACLRATLNLPGVAAIATLVPAPPSKPADHPGYDNRMDQVLRQLKTFEPQLDVRALLVPTIARDAQHEGERLTPAEIQACMQVDPAQLIAPLKSYVIVVDDVFTLGATFVACRELIEQIRGVRQIDGVFLAKTIWPKFDLSVFDLDVGL